MQTEHLKVTGMTCGGCTSKVGSALKAISGVKHADVSLSAEEAVVQYDERLTSPAVLKLAVTGAGYGLATEATIQKTGAQKGCCG